MGVVRLPKVPMSNGVKLCVAHDHLDFAHRDVQFFGDALRPEIPGDADDNNSPVTFGIKNYFERGGALIVK